MIDKFSFGGGGMSGMAGSPGMSSVGSISGNTNKVRSIKSSSYHKRAKDYVLKQLNKYK